MTRIDRYILFLYARILVICFTSIAGLWIVVNVLANLDEFTRFADSSGQSITAVLVTYFQPALIVLFERLSGMLALLALLFVVAWLNKTNEFTALLAAGVTKRRILRPLLVASACIILAAAAARELVIPTYQDVLDRNPQDLAGDFPRPMRPQYDERSGVLLQGKHLLTTKEEIVQPSLSIRSGPLRKTIGNKLLSESAIYIPANEQIDPIAENAAPIHPSGYLLRAVSHPATLAEKQSIYDDSGKLILATPLDTAWLKPDECFLASDIKFEMLHGGSSWKQFASTAQLIRHLEGEIAQRSRDVRVQVHQRLLRPAVDWTVILLGLPILLMRPDRHMFWVAGACLGVVVVFTAVVMGFAAMGGSSNLLSPAAAIWLPLVLFLPWGWARTGQAMAT